MATSPHHSTEAHRAGATLHIDVHGEGDVTALLIPTWEVVDSRTWREQVPALAPHTRVVTYDAAGTGKSSTPLDPARYSHANRLDDALAVLDATGTGRCVAVGYSASGRTALNLAALHPERVEAVVTIDANTPWAVDPDVDVPSTPYDPEFNAEPEGWGMFDPAYWKVGWPRFLDFFMREVCSDPGREDVVDDLISWAVEHDPQVAEWTISDAVDLDYDDIESRLERLDMPVTLIHGSADRIVGPGGSERLRDLIPGARLVILDGAGHSPHLTRPDVVNRAILETIRAAHDARR